LRAVLTRRVDNPETPVVGRIKYGFYDRIIAISEAIHAQLLADGATEKKLRIVRSAIDTAACEATWSRAQFREAFGCPADAVTVACVAQFIPRKGHADLINAWQEIAADYPAARLLLFGQGPEKQAVREQVASAGLKDSVIFCGFREDLRNFLGCADLLVHPALREGLGICLLEAQAAGVPVVAARAGGIPEAVQDGVSGILTEPSDTGALAAALKTMLGNREARERMGKAGKVYVGEHFSPASMVSGNLAVYKELINQ
jgi:glycosyltransferase involved in cell wall biosynthesis